MKLKVDQILDKVAEIEDADRDYAKLAKRWENIYFGKAFDDETIRKLREDDQEVVITHDPYDAVNLAQRLVSGKPKITIPPKENTEDSTTFANQRERWATAFWQQQARHRGKNLIDSGVWQSTVLGRHAYDLRWVQDVLPSKLRSRQSPFLLRSLDPRNVGVARGEAYTEYAYHKYRVKLWEAMQRWPGIVQRKAIKDRKSRDDSYRFEEVEITDFWYVDMKDGDIWNAILMDASFIKEPAKTKYPAIPIVMGFADTTESCNQALESLSLMYPLDGPWQAKCKQLSMQQTGALWYFWPFIYLTNDQGQVIPDFHPRPGGMEQFPPGTQLQVVQIQPNMPLAQSLIQQFEGAIQRSTFPTVMYGQAPGDIQSGFGVNMLADAARGRMRSIMQNLEATIETINAMLFGLVEVFGGKKGVPMWGMNNLNKPYSLTLTKEAIEDGYYENHVSLKAQLPENDTPRLTLGLQLQQAGLISARTFRDMWLQQDLPEDEENRIYLEQAMGAPELQAKRHALALRAFYPDKAELFMQGTPLEGVLEPPQPPQETPNMPSGMGSPDMGMMPPGGPPGGPQDMMGMPPEMGMMPPEAMPPMPPEMGGGVGLPTGPGGMADLQPPAVPMGVGGGIPPEMGAQITPEMLDMIRQADPLTFQAIVNGGMTDAQIQEVLMSMGGMGG